MKARLSAASRRAAEASERGRGRSAARGLRAARSPARGRPRRPPRRPPPRRGRARRSPGRSGRASSSTREALAGEQLEVERRRHADRRVCARPAAAARETSISVTESWNAPRRTITRSIIAGTRVPAVPRRPRAARSSDVITRAPAASTNAARRHLRPHAAPGELAARRQLAQPRGAAPRRATPARRAEADRGGRDVGRDHQALGADRARQQRPGEVLVEDRLDAAQPAVLAHHRDPAAAGGDDDRALADQRVDVPRSRISRGSGDGTTRRQPRSPRSSQASPAAIRSPASASDGSARSAWSGARRRGRRPPRARG